MRVLVGVLAVLAAGAARAAVPMSGAERLELPVRGGACQVTVPSPTSTECVSFDFSAMPATTFTLQDAAGDTYFVTHPCAIVEDASSLCTGSDPPLVPAPAYQAHGSSCIALGNVSEATARTIPTPEGQTSGVSLTYAGGQDNPGCEGTPRTVVFEMVCDATAPASGGPTGLIVEDPPCTYTVQWASPFACGAVNASANCFNPLTPLPVPTASQLAWQKHEIAGLIHFNADTFALTDGDPSCNPSNWNSGTNMSNPAVFAPSNLNFSNWLESLQILGAGHTILTAKHGCGYLLSNTNVTLPNGQRYPYAVARGTNFPFDVLHAYVAAMRGAGLGWGFYYSTGNNFFLNTYNFQVQAGPLLPGQGNVTQAQYESIVLQQVTELWTQYGNLTEIWFDHGYGTDLQQAIMALLQRFQPTAVGFGGYGVTNNSARWVGTESGAPPYPVWSTGTDNQGDPNSPVWCPAVSDTTLQEGDHWFYLPQVAVRTLGELIPVYHATVGQNCLLELDFAIDTTGNVHPTHATQYQALGNWIRTCYGSPVAATSGVNVTTLTLSLGATAPAVDRVIIQEDQTFGQRVRAYAIDFLPQGSSTWEPFSTGSSIGNKRIDLGSAVPVQASALRLVITGAAAPPIISNFAAFRPCPSS